MPRQPRFAPPGYNLHVTQRGNYGQQTFFTDYDHTIFISLIAHYAHTASVDVLAFCIMSNHVHFILHGHLPDSISHFMQSVTGRYAQYLHYRLRRRGRFWQSRFFACALDNPHLVAALRYVELNPVRAHMVSNPFDYPWSSAIAHAGLAAPPPWLNLSTFEQLFTPLEWQASLTELQPSGEEAAIREATRRNLPAAGSPEFVQALQLVANRKLERYPVGRPKKMGTHPISDLSIGATSQPSNSPTTGPTSQFPPPHPANLI